MAAPYRLRPASPWRLVTVRWHGKTYRRWERTMFLPGGATAIKYGPEVED